METLIELFQRKLAYVKVDFTRSNRYIFEIGGKDKTEKQIKGLDNAFIVADDITHGFHHKIPLWLFGFLY